MQEGRRQQRGASAVQGKGRQVVVQPDLQMGGIADHTALDGEILRQRLGRLTLQHLLLSLVIRSTG